jgi:hypothetical protein
MTSSTRSCPRSSLVPLRSVGPCRFPKLIDALPRAKAGSTYQNGSRCRRFARFRGSFVVTRRLCVSITTWGRGHGRVWSWSSSSCAWPRSTLRRGNSSRAHASARSSSASSAAAGPAARETRPGQRRAWVARPSRWPAAPPLPTSRACSLSAKEPCWEAALRGLPEPPDVLLVDATGRDHPRRAGLALHLGAVLDIPTIGVTHRPLVAEGGWPPDERGARSPLLLDDDLVGYWLRTRPGTRPLAVHAGWRTDVDTAVGVVLSTSRVRTPEPLRRARHRAREARAGSRLRAK